MKRAHILATGPSAKYFKPNGSLIIGVNAAPSIHPVDVLLLQDPPHYFDEKKLKAIVSHKGKVVINSAYASLWRHYLSEGAEVHPLIMDIWHSCGLNKSHVYPAGIDTGFTATAYALKIGCKEVITWGMDYRTHPEHSKRIERITKHWKELLLEAKLLNARILCGSRESFISELMPFSHH